MITQAWFCKTKKNKIKMATFKPVVFSTGRHVKSDGTTNIKIRVYHNKKSQYISTFLYIKPEFLLTSGDVSDEYPEADVVNYELREIIQEYLKIKIHLGRKRLQLMSCKDLKEYIVALSEPKSEFIDFVAFSREVIGKTKKVKTASWYRDSLEAFIWFMGRSEVDAREITAAKLNAFCDQLAKKGKKGKPLEAGSINNYMRGLRALFNKCKMEFNNDEIELEKISHDPFKKVKIPKYRRKRKNISSDDVKKIRDHHCDTFRKQIGRDVFMMMFYLMGININDLLKLSQPVHGRLEYERSKTDTEDNFNGFALSIKIEPELQSLLDTYSAEGFLSEIKSRYSDVEYFNKAVNTGLKCICKELDIPKVTTNWARHTWASLARNKAGISKSDIDFCLGHVNNDHKMADIYIEVDYSIYDDVNRKVLDLLK